MSYWARFVTRVAVRRVVALLVLAVLAWAGIGRAEARTVAGAYALCIDSQATFRPEKILVEACHIASGSPSSSGTWLYRYKLWEGASTSGFSFSWDAPCPSGTVWDDASKTCHNPAVCLSKPKKGSTHVKGTAPALCDAGCTFEPQGTWLQTGEYTVASSWAPTGAACAVGPATPAPETETQSCTPAGDGQTFCQRSDGKQCYSASTGRQICWEPGETGMKTDANTAQKRDPGDAAIPPPPPINGDTLNQQGQPMNTTTTVNNGGTTHNINTTTTNYQTGSGANAGGKNQGQPGDGSGSGSGSGDGDGDGDGDEDGPGGVGEGVGTLYEGSGKTVSSVMSDFHGEVMQSPILSGAAGFMSDCAFSGSCPVWTYDGGEYMGKLTFDALCSAALASLFQYAGYLIMAVAAFAAFRVALY